MNAKLQALIHEQGFVLKKHNLSEEFRRDVIASDTPSEYAQKIIREVLQANDCPVEPLQIVYEPFKLHESNAMHTHLVPADFQLLIWVPKDDDFKGRKFLYGKKDGPISSYTPKFGDICFMKTNDLDFIHGVSKLETDTVIKTIIVSVNCLGKLGEHVTVTTDYKPV